MMKKPNWVRRYGVLLTRRSTGAMGLILAFGFIGWIVFWGGSIHDNTLNIHRLHMFWAAQGHKFENRTFFVPNPHEY